MKTALEKSYIVAGHYVTPSEIIMAIPQLQSVDKATQKHLITAVDELLSSTMGSEDRSERALKTLEAAMGKLGALGHDNISTEIGKSAAVIEAHVVSMQMVSTKLRTRVSRLRLTALCFAATTLGLGFWLYMLLAK